MISITQKGCKLSLRLAEKLGEDNDIARFCFYKHSDEGAVSFDDIGALTKSIFGDFRAVIFICSCGIAVRSIAPLIRSKTLDPAVLVIDDNSKFVISLLCGHLGGANALCTSVSRILGAIPVITTATDSNGVFSPDLFAQANGLIITDMSAAKLTAAALLDGEMIGLESDYDCKNICKGISRGGGCRTGICISADTERKPFEITLNLVPKNIAVGIGCKKGISCSQIEQTVSTAFAKNNVDPNRICMAASIDIKAQEKGLLEFCKKYSLEKRFFSADELMSISGDFASSRFVLEKTGADNVCEKSAALCGGKLLIRKYAENGVTVAAAELPVEIDLERTMQ